MLLTEIKLDNSCSAAVLIKTAPPDGKCPVTFSVVRKTHTLAAPLPLPGGNHVNFSLLALYDSG